MIEQGLCPNCFTRGRYLEGYCTGCGYRKQGERDRRALPVGYMLRNRYYLGRVLGIGGFGITYLGSRAEIGYGNQICAIKEYFPQEWAIRGEDGTTLVPCGWSVNKIYSHGLDVFVNEARILQGLWENRTIVNIENFFQANNTAYIVMEYVRGETLVSHMKKQKQPFSLEQANWIVQNVAESLDMIHSFGLLHRDISPDNIMLTTSGGVKLIDFGSTRQFVMNEATDMSVLVKPGFAPMEQYSRTGRQGPWTDIYALAATYYYMVTGKKPLTAVDRCAGETLKTLREINPGIPPAISNFISHAMEMDYTKRIHTMREFVEGLRYACKYPDAVVKVPYVLMKAKKQVRKWKFDAEQSIKIGRAKEECDIFVSGREISRIHCEVRYDSRRQLFYIMDYSANGTYTDKGLIGKGRCVELPPGAFFYLVNGENQFYLEVR